MGRCLEPVAKRLPAKELLMDPFLAVDHGEQMLPMLKISSQKPSPNGTVEKIPSFQTNPRKRSTDMTITGTINPDDYTIFLKVAISDKDGIFLIKRISVCHICIQIMLELQLFAA